MSRPHTFTRVFALVFVVVLVASIGTPSLAAQEPPAEPPATAVTASETTDPVSAAIARGDTAWSRRGEGQTDGRALPEPIDEAVAAYEEAMAADTERLETYWKLLRALHFQGDYTVPEEDSDAKKEIFGRGKEVSEAALDLLSGRVGDRKALDKMEPAEFTDHFSAPEVAKIYFWASANWGLWGRAYGKFAAARQGVAKRVRDYAQIVIALDPEYQDGGGYRIHSRLHTEAPKIPFVTGWIDRDVAIEHIEKALEIAPDLPDNRFYYADTLVEVGDDREAEAIAVLETLVDLEPRPEKVTEDSATRERAKKLLARLR